MFPPVLLSADGRANSHFTGDMQSSATLSQTKTITFRLKKKALEVSESFSGGTVFFSCFFFFVLGVLVFFCLFFLVVVGLFLFLVFFVWWGGSSRRVSLDGARHNEINPTRYFFHPSPIGLCMPKLINESHTSQSQTLETSVQQRAGYQKKKKRGGAGGQGGWGGV